MQTTVRVLKVFLASPDDVRPERMAAEELVNNLNKFIGHFGWHIALYKWEDAIPGYGRPQEIINAAVDDCALFIGLLWERWGQPTGKYSSGFHEEYERALARRKTTNDPEIWLVFKAASPEKMKDPGTELTKVLEFRRTQSSLREVLYKEVLDSDDWKTKLQNWLWSHVVARAIPVSPSTQRQQPSSTPEPESADASIDHIEVSQQLLGISNIVTEAIKTGQMEFSLQEAKHLKEFDVARLYLLAATWMSRRYTGNTLGTHEMNVLYKYREKLEVTLTEYAQLFRAVLTDAAGVIPGWFWFDAMTSEAIRDQLLALVTRDLSDDVRIAALKLLRDAGINLPEDLRHELPLWDDAEAVRAEAYKYLVSLGDEGALSLVENNITAESADDSAPREARLSILQRLRPKEAFTEMIESGQYVSDGAISKLALHFADFEDQILLKGVENQWEEVRKFSISELAKRGRLPPGLAEKLTHDPSMKIRQLAFIELARQGNLPPFDRVRKSLSSEKDSLHALGTLRGLMGGEAEDEGDADAVIIEFYRGQSADKVLQAVDWFGLEGVLAYKSLATDHYDAIREYLRSDLENGFARVKQQSIAAFESEHGSEFANEMVERLEKHEDFLRSQFVEAALAGLAANGQPSDIRFGRQYLTSEGDTKLAAVRIVSRFGTAEDVPSLLQISREGWGELRDEAGAGALRLSSTPLVVALGLTRSASPKLVHAGYDWLYAHNSSDTDRFFEALMAEGSDTNRLRSVYYFFRNRKRADLEEMLEAQLRRETYYYNVVAWLDRLIYSPSPLRAFFLRELERETS